jgi:hypothetical protein
VNSCTPEGSAVSAPIVTLPKHIITITRTLTNCSGHDGPFMNLTDMIYVQSINTERIFILVINVLI